jgi:transport and Golgi organization protein 2
VCIVFLDVAPGREWPVVVAAVRDEFADRPWSPPAAHWPDLPHVVGPRDDTAGGTWLAVDVRSPALALVVNRPLAQAPAAGRRSRGELPLAALRDHTLVLHADELARFDGFHLLLATADRVSVWTWDGRTLERQQVAQGMHAIVPTGLDPGDNPRIAFSAPGFARAGAGPAVWAAWHELLAAAAVPPEDERALLLRHEFDGRVYASGAVSLVALSRDRVRHDFTGTPRNARSWRTVTAVAPPH